MRQVPTAEAPPLGIVGNGRVASHLRHYFDELGLPTRAWSRKSARSPPETLAPCQTVLILIRDEAILPFVDAWPELRAKRLVHCSGSLVASTVEAAHPLMTFGPDLYDLATYRQIPFVLDEGGTPFAALLPGLPNPSFTIPATERPYYHALCVMAGNFSTMLWSKLMGELQDRFEIPASAAHPFLSRTAANVLRYSSAALTGPLVRGDDHTVSANLEALHGDPFHEVYAAFVRAYAHRS